MQKLAHDVDFKLEYDRAVGFVRVRSVGELSLPCAAACGDDIECGMRSLCEGDCIVSIDGQAVCTVKEVLGAFRKSAGPVELRVANLSRYMLASPERNGAPALYDKKPCPLPESDMYMSSHV